MFRALISVPVAQKSGRAAPAYARRRYRGLDARGRSAQCLVATRPRRSRWLGGRCPSGGCASGVLARCAALASRHARVIHAWHIGVIHSLHAGVISARCIRCLTPGLSAGVSAKGNGGHSREDESRRKAHVCLPVQWLAPWYMVGSLSVPNGKSNPT